ncbi:hypothetical protein ACFC06_00490 [Nocardia sp. NPDC056064]|uniref:hypothetical protein n=1 Tax=Nocardia sp. NPDC056064 TaxID=3345701 RepID=UPI0035DE58E3
MLAMANDAASEGAGERSPRAVRITRLVAGARLVLGAALLIALLAGFSPGTGVAVAILIVLGIEFVVHGLIGLMLAKSPRNSIALVSIAVDSLIVVAGLTALLLAWERLSVAGAWVLIGGIAFAVLAAIVLAVVRTETG